MSSRRPTRERISSGMLAAHIPTFIASSVLILVCGVVSLFFKDNVVVEPSVMANFFSFYFLGLLTHIRVDADGKSDSISRAEFRVDLGIAVAILTFGVAALEVTRSWSGGQTSLSWIENSLWGVAALSIAFLTLLFVREELQSIAPHTSGKSLPRRYSWTVFLVLAGLFSTYTARVLSKLRDFSIYDVDGILSRLISFLLFLGVMLALAALAQWQSREVKILVSASRLSLLRYARVALSSLFALTVAAILMAAAKRIEESWDWSLGENEQIGSDSTPSDGEGSNPSLGIAFPWGSEAFEIASDNQFESGARLSDSVVSDLVFQRICESDIVIVAGGASATGSLELGEDLSLKRAFNLGEEIRALTERRSCKADIPRLLLLHLGQYQTLSGVDNVNQRRPFLLLLDGISNGEGRLPIDTADVARLVEGIHEGNLIEDICLASYSKREIREFGSFEEDHPTIDFDDNNYCRNQ